MLKKRMMRIGSSVGIVFPPVMLELLNITLSTELEITTDGQGIYVRPVGAKPPRPLGPPERVAAPAAPSVDQPSAPQSGAPHPIGQGGELQLAEAPRRGRGRPRKVLS